MHRTLTLLFLAALAVGTADVQARDFALDDLAKVSSIRSPQISPDGESVIVIVSVTDYDENRYVNRLVLIDVDTGESRDLTFDRPSVRRPRWSPSGEFVAFIANDRSTETPAPQVFMLPIAGGEARRMTSAESGVATFDWGANDGAVYYAAADKAPEPVDGPERHNQSFVVTNHDYLAQQRPRDLHVWRQATDGGDAERLSGDDIIVTAAQLSSFSVADDGSVAVFTSFPAEHPGDYQKMALTVMELDTGKLRRYGDALDSIAWGSVSPDGRRLAVSRPNDGVALYKSHHIAVGDADGGELRSVSDDIDRSLWGAVWMPDGRSLLIGARDNAVNTIWHQPLDGSPSALELGDLQPATGYGPVALDVGPQGEVAFIATTSTSPAELYWLDSVDDAPRPLTDFNAEVAALDMGASEEIRWMSEGFEANGILTFPPDFNPKKRYPLVLKIHGGPMSGSTLRFDELSQLLAARGFIVFAPNYRGSDNLGADYQAAIIHDAGAGPGRDVMAGVDAVVAKGYVDESRIGVSGWSYGGYMTSWLIGNYPDVWRAAMAGAPVTDYVDQYTLADLNSIFGNGFDKTPWSPDGQAEWRAQSPLAYAYKATAPTLILCNTGDLRVPITESYKLYHALDDHGVPVQFVAYPIPGHFPGDPVHRRDVYKRWGDWMEQRFSIERDAPVGD